MQCGILGNAVLPATNRPSTMCSVAMLVVGTCRVGWVTFPQDVAADHLECRYGTVTKIFVSRAYACVRDVDMDA